MQSCTTFRKYVFTFQYVLKMEERVIFLEKILLFEKFATSSIPNCFVDNLYSNQFLLNKFIFLDNTKQS